jgi:hypothetical protein
MSFSIKAELDAVVYGSFASHTFTCTDFRQQIDSTLLKYASADGSFDFFSAAAFENERINPFLSKQKREQ